MMILLLFFVCALGTQKIGAPVPEGEKTELTVAYVPSCKEGEFLDLDTLEGTQTLVMIATEECQDDPLGEGTARIRCEPNEELTIVTYDNLGCRGIPLSETTLTNGHCSEAFTVGGFVANWKTEAWNTVCLPPDVEGGNAGTKREWCKAQGQDGRKACLRWSCCSWTDSDTCIAKAKKCEDRKNVASCDCPGGGVGVVVNKIADINDDLADGCSCPKTQSQSCFIKDGEELRQVTHCTSGECLFGVIEMSDDRELCTTGYDPYGDNNELVDTKCCTNSHCVPCVTDKPQLPQCYESESRAKIQLMVVGRNWSNTLDMISCAMSFLNQRQDSRLTSTLCNCYMEYAREEFEANNCWANDAETASLISQWEKCEDFLGLNSCHNLRQGKCKRKHHCVFVRSDGTKKCVPYTRADNFCSETKQSRCLKKYPTCTYRHNEGCIVNGPYSCEGLSRSRCTKQKGCFFQNPYGCRKNKQRHNKNEKLG